MNLRDAHSSARLVAVVAAVATVGGGALALRAERAAPSPFAPTPSSTVPVIARVAHVVLWGDSLAWEAADPFRHLLEGRSMTVETRTRPGSAPCDWRDEIRDWAHSKPIDIAVVEFSGNGHTPCMRDGNGRRPTLEAKVERYRADVNEIVAELRRGGARILLVGPPSFRAGRDPGRVDAINALYRQLAVEQDGVTYVDGGADLLHEGQYTDRLSCLRWEAADHGCVDGMIEVRARDGIHFCPPSLGRLSLDGCSSYSSGALRFAIAMARPVRQALGSPEPADGRGAFMPQ